MHADICEDATRGYQVLAEEEGCRYAHRLDRGIHPLTSGKCIDLLRRLSVSAVDRLSRTAGAAAAEVCCCVVTGSER